MEGFPPLVLVLVDQTEVGEIQVLIASYVVEGQAILLDSRYKRTSLGFTFRPSHQDDSLCRVGNNRLKRSSSLK